MKPETILNAMGKQGWSVNWPADLWDDNVAPYNVIKARRQYRAFRNRILKMFAEKDRLHRALSDIWGLGLDYDGYRKAKSLMGLIDEIVEITEKARAGEEWWTNDTP